MILYVLLGWRNHLPERIEKFVLEKSKSSFFFTFRFSSRRFWEGRFAKNEKGAPVHWVREGASCSKNCSPKVSKNLCLSRNVKGGVFSKWISMLAKYLNENWKCEKKNRITRSFVVNFLERSDRDFRILSVWCKCGCLSYGLYKLVPEEKIGWDLLRKLFATKVISFSFSGKQLWARSATSFYPKFQHNFPVKIPNRW